MLIRCCVICILHDTRQKRIEEFEQAKENITSFSVLHQIALKTGHVQELDEILENELAQTNYQD